MLEWGNNPVYLIWYALQSCPSCIFIIQSAVFFSPLFM